MQTPQLRIATSQDTSAIIELYRLVAAQGGGLARTKEEISWEYVQGFCEKSEKSGIQLLIENSDNGKILGEIHAYQPEPQVFKHVLSDLTIAIHPHYQSLGLGKRLFEGLLKHVQEERKDILRIELIARESNTKAINFYEKLGFQIEGKLRKRIQAKQYFEADIFMAWLRES